MDPKEIVFSKVDWKALRARVSSGQGTADDAILLLESSDRYRKRLETLQSLEYAKMSRLNRDVWDFKFTLGLAHRAIDPCEHHLNLSEVDLFKCILEPKRLRETRDRVAEEYLESLKWRASFEAKCEKRRAEELAKAKQEEKPT